MAADEGHGAAEAALRAFQAEVAETYRQAEETARRRLLAYLQRSYEQDEAKRLQVLSGELAEVDWKAWRRSKIATGKAYRQTLAQCAAAYTEANELAVAVLAGKLPQVYAENANYGAWQVETGAGVETSWSLVDAATVETMLKDGAAQLPKPTVKAAKDRAWNRKQVAAQVTQGILLGEGIPAISRRVSRVTGANAATATRTARTAVTAAECAGRVSSYERARALGLEFQQEWLATLDGRTRHSHRLLDGERVEVGGTFSNGCRYPGDPEAPYGETMNCRCTLVAAFGDEGEAKRSSKLGGMSYEEWKASRPVRGPQSAGRTIKEFMQMPSTKAALEREGLSYTAARKLLTAQLGETSVSGNRFRSLTKSDQQAVFQAAIAPNVQRRKKKEKGKSAREGKAPANEQLYASQVRYVERHGCIVVRGGDEARRHLELVGADAAYVRGGGIIFFHDNPTTSEVLEEVFHFEQDMRGDYEEYPAREVALLREIDAQKHLLEVAERYNIPIEETAQTRASLKDYEEQLDKLRREEP